MSTTTAETKVVIVDDHPLILRGIRDLVESSDDLTVVGETGSSLEALRLIADAEPDVAVIDVALPEMSGIAIVRQLVSEGCRTRFILISAHEDSVTITQGLATGARGYLLKRSASEHLLHAIRIASKNGFYMDPAIIGRFLPAQNGAWPHAGNATRAKQGLTDREREVIKLIAFGYSNKEVAAKLGVTAKSVETYKMRASDKLEMRTRSRFVQYALLQGWFRELQS